MLDRGHAISRHPCRDSFPAEMHNPSQVMLSAMAAGAVISKFTRGHLLRAARRLARVAADQAGGVIDLVYPPQCVLCGCDRPPTPAGLPLCGGCEAEFATHCAAPGCDACGRPFGVEVNPSPSDGRLPPCPWCDGRGVGRVKRVARLSLFDGPLRQLVHQIKFHGRWELADALGDRLARAASVRELVSRADVLVPVPLHRLRQAQRGFNQSERIARRLAREFAKPLLQPAIRTKRTAAQTVLTSVTARQANLREAFVLLHPDQVFGRSVVIVDDVTTSGATLRSFAHCLYAGRPRTMGACVLAVADARGRDFEAT